MPISTPTQIAVPFATSGLKNAIPAASDPVTGKAGYDQGFTAINMTPRTAGGIPPYGQDMNGIFFDISTALQFLEAGGSFPYSSAFATAVGGYPLGALVSRTDGSGLWRNTVANNTTNPETFGAGWQPEDAGVTSITMKSSNVTLTALQAARSIIYISGALTTNLQLIFPTYLKQWQIINICTGAFAVTAKTASGSGAVISSSGGMQSVLGDGVNIVPSGGNSSQVFSVAPATSTQHALQAGQKGISTFTTNGNFTVPAGVTTIYLSGCGGGGGGGGGGSNNIGSAAGSPGGGGGAAVPNIRVPVTVTPGQVIPITIGAAGTSGKGGAQGSNNATSGGNGGATLIGTSGAIATWNPGGGGGSGQQGASTGNVPGGAGGMGTPSGAYAPDGVVGGASTGYPGVGGSGSSGPFGGGGGGGRSGQGSSVVGATAGGFGAGGGGGGGVYQSGGTGANGGAGSPGLVLIEW